MADISEFKKKQIDDAIEYFTGEGYEGGFKTLGYGVTLAKEVERLRECVEAWNDLVRSGRLVVKAGHYQ